MRDILRQIEALPLHEQLEALKKFKQIAIDVLLESLPSLPLDDQVALLADILRIENGGKPVKTVPKVAPPVAPIISDDFTADALAEAEALLS